MGQEGLPEKAPSLPWLRRWFSGMRGDQKRALSHLRPLSFYRVQDFVIIDEPRREISSSSSPLRTEPEGLALLGAGRDDHAMGSRRLRQWLNYPLVDVQEIEGRLEGVAELKDRRLERKRLREALEGIQDMERLTSRIFLGHANARDLVG